EGPVARRRHAPAAGAGPPRPARGAGRGGAADDGPRPADRYQTAAEVAQALQPFTRPGQAEADLPVAELARPPVLAGTVALPEVPAPGARRRRATARRRGTRLALLVAGLLLGVLLVMGGSALLAWRAWQARGRGGPTVGQPGGKPRVLLVIPHRGFWYPDYEK